jgi:hypothetical protein
LKKGHEIAQGDEGRWLHKQKPGSCSRRFGKVIDHAPIPAKITALLSPVIRDAGTNLDFARILSYQMKRLQGSGF